MGVTAKGAFECDLFGKLKLSGKFGATFGVGGDAGGSIEFDPHNLWWGIVNVFYAAAHDCQVKRKRQWLLPLEENVVLGTKAKEMLKEVLETLTAEHKEEWLRLEQWRVLETKIRALVISRNAQMAGLRPTNMAWI